MTANGRSRAAGGRDRALAILLLPAFLLPGLLAPRPSPAAERPRPAGREKSPEELLEELRSADAFYRERAEADLRRRGPEILPILAAELEDTDRERRLRNLRIFDDLLRIALDELDNDSLARLRDVRESEMILQFRTKLPAEILRLREEIAKLPAEEGNPEKDRPIAAERAEKSQKLRAAEEALRDAASDARLDDVRARIEERSAKVEEGRKGLIALGPAAFGPATSRREGVPGELLETYEEILVALRAATTEGDLFPEETEGGEPASPFERKRYLLSALWAWEVDRKGPFADRAGAILERHIARTLEDLRAGIGLVRERAEEDLFTLRGRGLEAVRSRSADLPPGGAVRLESLYRFRISPRLAERTGIDFRGYRDLPFRARRRMVIHYARVAGREAIPTLRLIALGKAGDGEFEPSLRVRLAAAEALAGPAIRDRTALKAFEALSLPELLKIPQIARELALINGIQLTEEKRYDEAIVEFQKVLDESPYDFRANYQIAFAYMLVKSFGKAILHFEIARRIQPDDDLTLYNLCCAYSLDGQIGKALEALESAVKAGFIDFRHMEADPDLAPLRGEPRFHELIDRLRSAEGAGGEEKPPDRKAEKEEE